MPAASYTQASSLRCLPSSASVSVSVSVLLALSSLFAPACSTVLDDLRHNYFDPAPAPEDGAPLSASALRNPAYLPVQIGALVGAYALSLVLVASILLLLAKKRREHLRAAEDDLDDLNFPLGLGLTSKDGDDASYRNTICSAGSPQSPTSPIHNFSYPTAAQEKAQGPYVNSVAPLSSSTLGVNPRVDPGVVAADREMAQQQLEEMYRHVMEQEAAKEAGVTLDRPPTAISPVSKTQSTMSFPKPTQSTTSLPKQGFFKKGKGRPANLELEREEPEKTESKTSSIFSALKSPMKKKNLKGISISSPILTPKSGTFPRHHEGEEMASMQPRYYTPASPPPIPAEFLPQAKDQRRHHSHLAPITPPDMSPESTLSIDERIGAQLPPQQQHQQPQQDDSEEREENREDGETEPESAITERSTTPLVGLPSSPKPGMSRFPSLPASPRPGSTFPRSDASEVSSPTTPKPGSSFSRPNAPSAVRTGGLLPFRAYEPAVSSPSTQHTKQTTFERSAPLSPGGLRTPWTGAPVPYTPYQPFSPVVPITPGLVTKADRKRMKQMQPKTPTVEMVRSSEDIW